MTIIRGRYTGYTVVEDGTADGQILFWDNTNKEWIYTETTEIYWDDVNKRVGINNSSPTSKLDVSGTVTVTRLLAGGITE